MFIAVKVVFFAITFSLIYKLFFMSSTEKIPSPLLHINNSSEASMLMKAHSELYGSSQIVKVLDNVYVAVGYALANMILIIGEDGIIVVDTTESSRTCLEVFKEFQKITDKPLKAVIITHFHPDHIFGAAALVDANSNEENKVEVIMHESTKEELQKFQFSSQIGFQRASRQFGVFLERETEHLDSGIGPLLKLRDDDDVRSVEETQSFQTEKSYTIAGVTFTLLHTPGETDDQITMWIPEWKVVFPADNIYQSFPNIYAIRGSSPRDCTAWYRSLDKVRALRAKYMVPSHTRPLIGETEIFETITCYRDAIQYINDQTIRLMNKGVDIGEIVERIRLPPSLASHQYLQEFYGRVSWSVRSVYQGHLGWFDGDPVNLDPLAKCNSAEKLSRLLEADFEKSLTSAEKLLLAADKSLKLSDAHFNASGNILKDELQWALELSSYALKATKKDSSLHEEAKKTYAIALKSLAMTTINANARNYYLTYAKELYGTTTTMPPQFKINAIKGFSLESIMKLIPMRLDVDSCDDTKLLTIIFEFSDVKQSHAYNLRHCILEHVYDPLLIPNDFDSKVTTTSIVWKKVLSKTLSALGAFATGDIAIQGNPLSLTRFINMLDS